MHAWEISDVTAQHEASQRRYLEFLRVASLSAGLYVLPAGGMDPQQPHTEDEVYVIVAGQAQLRVDGEDRAVHQGSIVYVAANVEHRFHTIEEELQVLVFFAPAEYSQA
jgi:mannose-6-phosphate isomerase-like protein (cupin superfamily)